MKHLVFEADGEPLSKQLADRLREAGREVSDVQVLKLLEQGGVYKDKRRWRDPGVPSAGSSFEVFWPDLPIEEFTLDPSRVVWRDERFLIVDKPAGVNAAPSPFSDRDCLTWGVQKWLNTGFEVHAVHRLDRDTRGLMFFAQDKEAELSLHTLFRERRLRKVYRALTPALDSGNFAVGTVFRWRGDLDWRGKVQSAATTAVFRGPDEQGRGVWTVLPHTGRPHQIRKHFARFLTPLWGDQVYAPGVYDRWEPLGLVCAAYRFRHPFTNERLTVTLPDLT